MSAKYFLDTNVFVYALEGAFPAKSKIAVRLIKQGLDSGNGIVSYQVVQEFFNLAFRKFAAPMSTFEAEQYLNTMFRPLLAVHTSPVLFVSALQVCSRHRLSWYESLIVAAAQQAECSILYTEDMQHGRRFDNLKIENPFQ